jgi:hypothetical protein
MGYHYTQLAELRVLIAKPEAEMLQPATRNWFPQGLRPTEQYYMIRYGTGTIQ